MMRQLSELELKLMDKLHNPNTTKEEKDSITQQLIDIDKELSKDYPFCH